MKERSHSRLIVLVCAIALVLSGSGISYALAAKKPSLNKTKVTIKKGRTVKLKLKNSRKKVKWSSSNKKIATVNQKGLVKAKKAGKAKIIVRSGRKKYVCKVKVIQSGSNGGGATQAPLETGAEPTRQPGNTRAPQASYSPSPEPANTPKMSEAPGNTSTPQTSSEPGNTSAPQTSSEPGNTSAPQTSSEPGNTSAPQTSSEPGNTSTPQISSEPGTTQGPGTTAAPGSSSTIVDNMPASPSHTLTVGRMQITLGMTSEQVAASVGTEPLRKELSPQGFDTYVYNPSSDYRNYMLVYFSDNKVVGMSTISRYFSYEDLVFAGNDVSALSQKGFTGLGYGYNAAYKYTGNSANVIAYVDQQGDRKVYGIQIFASQYSLDNVLRPQDCTYTSETCSSVVKEMPELVNAFRRYKGINLLCTVRGTTAQAHSDKMVAAGNLGNISSTDPDGTVLVDRMDAAYGYVMGWGENNGSGSADAFGYISFWIDDTTADKAAGTNYTKPYNNLVETVDGEDDPLSAYYVCAGLSFDTSKKTYVTYATMDFYFY